MSSIFDSKRESLKKELNKFNKGQLLIVGDEMVHIQDIADRKVSISTKNEFTSFSLDWDSMEVLQDLFILHPNILMLTKRVIDVWGGLDFHGAHIRGGSFVRLLFDEVRTEIKNLMVTHNTVIINEDPEPGHATLENCEVVCDALRINLRETKFSLINTDIKCRTFEMIDKEGRILSAFDKLWEKTYPNDYDYEILTSNDFFTSTTTAQNLMLIEHYPIEIPQDFTIPGFDIREIDFQQGTIRGEDHSIYYLVYKKDNSMVSIRKF